MILSVELYPHQKEAVRNLSNGKVLWGGVGTGKSITAAAYYMEKEAPKDVYVITTAKKRDSLDWAGEFAKFGVGRAVGATVAGVLHVDSWNNIGRYRKVRGGLFIFDEQRLVGHGKWTRYFIEISRRNNWILLSASPGDTWLDYIAVFVANGFYNNRTEFIREHVVYSPYAKFPKVVRYDGVGKLARYKHQILVPMGSCRQVHRETHEVQVEHNKALMRRVLIDRWHVYETRPLKNVAELFLVARRVANTDSSRISAVKSLTERHPKLIVFYNFNVERDALIEAFQKDDVSCHGKKEPEWQTQKPVGTTSSERTSTPTCGLSSSVLAVEQICQTNQNELERTICQAELPSESGSTLQVAEWNGRRHQPIPDGPRWLYLVQYQAGAEGWNCIDTNAMVFFSLPYSYKQFVQAMGRIDRLNTEWDILHYYILLSDSYIDKSIQRALRAKKNFNEGSSLIARRWAK